MTHYDPCQMPEADHDSISSRDRETVPMLMQYIFSSTRGTRGKSQNALAWRFAIAFRRFTALAYVANPALFGKTPAWRIAESLGISPAQFSRLCSKASNELGGLRPPNAKTDRARQIYSNARLGGYRGTRQANASAMIQVKPSAHHREAAQRGVDRCLKMFVAGEPWGSLDAQLLERAGMIDDCRIFTPEGLAAVQKLMEGKSNE